MESKLPAQGVVTVQSTTPAGGKASASSTGGDSIPKWGEGRGREDGKDAVCVVSMGSDDISNQVWALQMPIDNDALHLHLDANTFVTVYKFSSKTPGVVIVKRSEADDLPRDTAQSAATTQNSRCSTLTTRMNRPLSSCPPCHTHTTNKQRQK